MSRYRAKLSALEIDLHGAKCLLKLISLIDLGQMGYLMKVYNLYANVGVYIFCNWTLILLTQSSYFGIIGL